MSLIRRLREGFHLPVLATLALTTALPSCSFLSPTTTPSVVQVVVSAGNPGPSVNEGLVGTNGPGPAGDASIMKALGLDWVRVGTNVGAGYNCSNGTWSLPSLDADIAAVEALGGTPEIDVGGTPACLVTNPPPGLSTIDDPPDIGADNQAAWENLVYEMAYHEITTEKVSVFEVENEPDWVFFNGTMAQYFQVYNDTATALEKAAKAANTSILVGGPTLANVLDTMDTTWLDPFLGYVSSNHLPLDFLSWHVYPNDPFAGPGPNAGQGPYCFGKPPGLNGNPCWYNPNLDVSIFASETAQAKESLAAYPALHPLLVIDEWNLDGEYDARQDGPYDAAFAAAALTQALSVGVDRMCLWYTADNTPGTLNNWGMLYSNLTPKPVYYTFLFWHESAGRVLPASFYPQNPPQSPLGSVGGVASIRSDGTVNVLLYNFQPYDWSGNYGVADPTPTDHYVVLDITGLKTGLAYTWSRQAVDASHIGTPDGSGPIAGKSGGAQVAFALPGDSVSLVTVAPHG